MPDRRASHLSRVWIHGDHHLITLHERQGKWRIVPSSLPVHVSILALAHLPPVRIQIGEQQGKVLLGALCSHMQTTGQRESREEEHDGALSAVWGRLVPHRERTSTSIDGRLGVAQEAAADELSGQSASAPRRQSCSVTLAARTPLCAALMWVTPGQVQSSRRAPAP